jgi:hypothetical protein
MDNTMPGDTIYRNTTVQKGGNRGERVIYKGYIKQMEYRWSVRIESAVFLEDEGPET